MVDFFKIVSEIASAIVAIVTVFGIIVGLIKRLRHGALAINFLNRKPDPSKMLNLFDNDNIVAKLDSVAKAREHFSKELIAAAINEYSTKSHKYKMGDSALALCAIGVIPLLFVGLGKHVDYIVNYYKGLGEEWVVLWNGYLLLLIVASIALPIVFIIAVWKFVKVQLYEIRSVQLADRWSVSQASLDQLSELVSPQVEYAFIDATISKASRARQVGVGNGELKVQSYVPQWLWDDRSESEYRLSFRHDYAAAVKKCVQIMVERRFGASRDVICFVYSEYGITAVQVVAALEEIGVSAYYIGQLDGRLSQVRRVVMEMNILRKCGLL